MQEINEFCPPISTKRWKILEKDKYNQYDSLKIMKKKTEYTLNKHFMDKLQNNRCSSQLENGVAIIYLCENLVTDKKYVGNTVKPLAEYIRIQLKKRKEDRYSVFDNLNNYGNFLSDQELQNVKFTILEYLLYTNERDVSNRMVFWKSKYMKQNIIPNPENDIIYSKRIKIFEEAFEKSSCSNINKIGYIFLIKNKRNHKIFVGGGETKPNKSTIVNLLIKTKNKEFAKDLKLFGRNMFSFQIIDKFAARHQIEIFLRIDFYKTNLNTIINGYNNNYCFEYSKSIWGKTLRTGIRDIILAKIFVLLESSEFKNKFEDNNFYKNVIQYIYCITNRINNKKYFAIGNKNMKDDVLDLYSKALKDNIKHNKILKAFREFKYSNFKFEIILTKDSDDFEMNLNDELEKLIKKHDTINDGYNIDIDDVKRKIMFGK